MRSLTAVSFCAALLAVGGAEPTASGQSATAPAQRSAESRRKAQEHFEAARQAFRLEDYQRAIAEFRLAYALHPDPEFYFNIGEAYRKWGKPGEALESYRKYLELDPAGRAAAVAQAFAAEIDRELAAAQELQPASGPSPLPAAPIALTGSTDSTPRRSSGRALRWTGISIGGAGLVLLGAGAYLGMRARSLESDLDGAAEFDSDAFEAGEEAERGMIVTTAVGATALIAGAVLFVLGVRQPGAQGDAQLSLAPHGDGVLLGAQGRF